MLSCVQLREKIKPTLNVIFWYYSTLVIDGEDAMLLLQVKYTQVD